MKKQDEKKRLLKEYEALAHALAKVPSSREVRKFICSSDKISNYFGSFSTMQEEALAAYPELQFYQEEQEEITKDQLRDYVYKVEDKRQKKEQKTAVKEAVELDYLERFAENIFQGRVTPIKPPKSKEKIDRALILTISDTHFGAEIKASETGHESYGLVEEARRLAEVVKQTIEYKPQYRSHTELHVNLLGDIIQGKLHDVQDAAPMAEQKARAIHLLIQAFSQLAENFSKVSIHCATGNHGRDMMRHQGRATSSKWDSDETVIYYAVKQALTRYPNVTVDIPRTPFATYDVFGHKVLATHGDTVINPGNPGKALHTKSLNDQINAINATLKDQDEFKLVFTGHVHVGSVVTLNCGATLITNAALSPIDNFCVSIGILEGQSSQTLIECTPKYALGDIRLIKVGLKQDLDESLDKVITPWKEF